jgi:hypothetical protein
MIPTRKKKKEKKATLQPGDLVLSLPHEVMFGSIRRMTDGNLYMQRGGQYKHTREENRVRIVVSSVPEFRNTKDIAYVLTVDGMGWMIRDALTRVE